MVRRVTMIVRMSIRIVFACFLSWVMAGVDSAFAQTIGRSESLDTRVQRFLSGARHEWRDWNVPYEDGQVLYGLIVKKNFTRALEIGTSTGHSAIWIAWALSKTGGKLITIEVDKARHDTALRNFEKAGVEFYIDARLADAHQLVEELGGPFDFVFSDADKEWYTQYFKALDPKLVVGGCYTAHNALRGGGPGVDEFLRYVRSRPNYQTSIDRSSAEGISISCKVGK
jgi:predicted O-methyltransferase YrrM